MVEFPVTIPEGERDAKLLEKLLDEGEGVLAFAVEGLLRYHDHGFIVPNEVASTTQAYREEMDPIKQFLEDCVQPADGEHIRASELHNHYLAWAKDAGCEEMGTGKFKKKLKDKGYKDKRKSEGFIWQDIKLSDAPPQARPGSPADQVAQEILEEPERYESGISIDDFLEKRDELLAEGTDDDDFSSMF